MSWAHCLQRLRQLPQALQFVGVGGAAAATHLAVVFLLVQGLAMAPLVANVLAFLVAFVVSYNGHAWFTFASNAPRGWAVVAKYFAVACLSFVVNELLYWVALHWLHWHYFWSLLGVLLLVAMGTFVLSKFWAFRAPDAGAAQEK
ncbi:MAG: GtrA family protein [Acidovorax sp.]|jgi:putative flippase GtrA|nr:GtrA family protein [Acidovorax sp.]